jgi:nucleoside-diphosphate-sugar epimerase
MIESFYRGKRALVTGGLGFIGSNLALRLDSLGARVTVLDSSLPGCGANPANLAGSSVAILPADLNDPPSYRSAVADAEIVFNLAGEISHIHSMQFPERDLEINTVSQLRFLQTAAESNPGLRILYAGTRQVFGRPKYLPVDEAHPIRPVDFNGVHKYAASMYHLMMSDLGQIDATILRLTNVYGPRMSLNVFGQGFLGVFFRQALLGETITLYGSGDQLRDPLYVDDAVEAFLLAGARADLPYRECNVGGLAPLSLAEIARSIATAAGAPAPVFTEFPPHLKPIDIGSYYTSSGRLAANPGWRPNVSFSDGVAKTLEFFRSCLDFYLDAGQPPRKELPEYQGRLRRLEFR